MPGVEISISITDVPPAMDFIQDMVGIVTYLRSKPHLTTSEKKIIETHDRFWSRLEREPHKELAEPYLTLLKE